MPSRNYDYYDDHTWRPATEHGDGLDGIELAYGLGESEKEWVEALVEEYRKHAPHNAMLRDYYDGKVKVDDYGAASNADNDQACHWPQQAVDALASRIHLERFTSEDGDALQVIEDTDSRCGIVSGYNSYIGSKLLYGCMCATVNMGADGKPAVMYHAADTFTAIPEGGKCMGGTVAAGMAIARFERPWWDRRYTVPTVVHVHLPHNTIELRQEAQGEWVAENGEHGFDKPMLYVFTHNRKGGVAPFGQTRITRFVRNLTDDAIRCLWHMQISGAFYSMAKMYVTGLTEEQFDEMVSDKQSYQLDRLLLLTGSGYDGEGGNQHVGQLTGNSPQPFVDELRSLAAQFSGATGVPLNSLGIVQDNPSSAEAIQAAREDICLIARSDIEEDRAVLANVTDTILRLSHDYIFSRDYNGGEADIRAKFSDPLLSSMASKADWATKVAAIMPDFAGTDMAARMVGFDDADIAAMKSERIRSRSDAILDRIMATPTVEQDAEPATAEAEAE